MGHENFSETFGRLTGNAPFPWQLALYERFITGDFPSSCDLPTGLGKTSVIAIWLIALAAHPDLIPRRLAYVVNRRTVVDQTTDEVEKLRRNLTQREDLAYLRNKLAAISRDSTDGLAIARPGDAKTSNTRPLLAVSTLRGQFADNRQWSADPSRPAVIVGTVDMIGSRLLFSGYGASFKTRPLYAGFLGQDTLIVHDEAHLEPAFQTMIEGVRDQQAKEPAPFGAQFRLKVMELSATSRGDARAFGLQDADLAHHEVRKRIESTKVIRLVPSADAKKMADEIADLALKRFSNSARAVLIFARRVEDIERIAKKLPQQRTRQLTGTLRGLERDQLVQDHVFRQFLPGAEPLDQTVYLVCTSAGEVGVNISADHMICDLSTFDSMAQRLGRVNRFGNRADTEVHVFHPTKLDKDSDQEVRLARTMALLEALHGDGSPRAISRLDRDARRDAFATQPIILPLTDILLDAWTLTTIREPMPGRPKVEVYLHGIRDQDPPETHIAWRQEVGVITGDLLRTYRPEDLLEDYPLKPHELLRDRSDRVFKHLAALATRSPEEPVWLVDDDGGVQVARLGALADREGKGRMENRAVLLAPTAGGLRDGMLDGGSHIANDVADEIFQDHIRQRARVWSDDSALAEKTSGMRLIRRIVLAATDVEDDDAQVPQWQWFERPLGGDGDGSKSAPVPIRLDDHISDVVREAERFLKHLTLPPRVKEAVVLAAQTHDLGKRRQDWQRSIGNPNPQEWFAKSGAGWRPRDLGSYRHEFGSVLDLLDGEVFAAGEVGAEIRDLVLHLVGAHHGYGRPHFPDEYAVDSAEHTTIAAVSAAGEVPQRFARLQRRYGRWGLAYLESLLRAADYEASAHPAGTEVRQ